MSKDKENVDLSTLSYQELRAEAKAREIEISKIRSKGGLIKAITKYEQAQESPPEDKPEEVGNDDSVKSKKSKAKKILTPEDIDGPIDVFDRNGNFVTTYDEEIMGENYKELCEEFIGEQPENAPKMNKERTIRPHDTSFNSAEVVEAVGGRIRKTFTRKEYGVYYRQQAISYSSAGLAKLVPKMVDEKLTEIELSTQTVLTRVELKK